MKKKLNIKKRTIKQLDVQSGVKAGTLYTSGQYASVGGNLLSHTSGFYASVGVRR